MMKQVQGQEAVYGDRRQAMPPSDAPSLNEPLGGYIFVCNNETMEDDIRRELFGLPQKYHDSVRAIQPGMPLFLYNYSVHQLHGVYEASSEGGLNIDADSWDGKNGRPPSRFPAQVRVKLSEKRPPLDESIFRPFLFHYDGQKFRLELSKSEANALLELFRSSEKPKEENGGVHEEALHDEILEYAEAARPSRDSRLSAERAVNCLRETVKGLWESADVEVFGSYATGLALPHSDVDVAVIGAPIPPRTPEVQNLSGARISAPLIRDLAAAIQKQSWCESLYTIETARIPVIKIKCRVPALPRSTSPHSSSPSSPTPSSSLPNEKANEGSVGDREDEASNVPTADVIGPVRKDIVKMDISIALSRPSGVAVENAEDRAWVAKLEDAASAHNGAAARELVIQRLRQLPALGPMVLLMKAYLHHRGLKDVYTGGLGSFSLTMMLVFYLERAPVSCGPPVQADQKISNESNEHAPSPSTLDTKPQSLNEEGKAEASGDGNAPPSDLENNLSSKQVVESTGVKKGSKVIVAPDSSPTSSVAGEEQKVGEEGDKAASPGEEKALDNIGVAHIANTGGDEFKGGQKSEELAVEGPFPKGVVVDELPASMHSVPIPNLGTLLMGFLYLFGHEMDLSRLRLILKGTNGSGGGVFWQDPTIQPAALWIDDPLRPGVNIGAGSFAMWHVQAALREMLHLVTKTTASGAVAPSQKLPSSDSSREYPLLESAFSSILPPPSPVRVPT